MKPILRRLIFGGISIFLILTLPLLAEENDEISLSLEEATSLALKNNFDIQVYQLDHLIKEEDILVARSAYDTTLTMSYEYDEDRLKPSSTLAGTKTTTAEQTFDLSKKLPTGTILSLGMAHKREFTDSTYASPNPYHESSLEASLRQPLLRDARGIQDRNNLKITQLDIDNSGYTSHDKIEKELASAQKAYWLLALAWAKMDVESEMEEAAKRLYEASKKNFDMGIMEAAELFATAANLKERERDVELARDNLNYAMNELRFKLSLPKDIVIKCKDEISFLDRLGKYKNITSADNLEESCSFVNTSHSSVKDHQKQFKEVSTAFPDLGEIDEVGLINKAFSSRRDYKLAKNKVRREKLSLEMKRNALWPQVDIVGTFKRNNVDTDFGNSVSDIFNEDNPEYIATIEFTFPLENREARAEFNQKKIEKAKMIIGLKRTESLILIEVNNAISRLRSTREAARLQGKALEFQEKKYQAEEWRFKRGRSDTDHFIRYQQDFLRAKLKYLDSLYAYIAADIDLKLALNTLLEEAEG